MVRPSAASPASLTCAGASVAAAEGVVSRAEGASVAAGSVAASGVAVGAAVGSAVAVAAAVAPAVAVGSAWAVPQPDRSRAAHRVIGRSRFSFCIVIPPRVGLWSDRSTPLLGKNHPIFYRALVYATPSEFASMDF